MTEYAYSRYEPFISSTTSMSRIRSSYESSGGGVFVLRRAIAAGSSCLLVARVLGARWLKRERHLTRTIVDRGTDNADQAPASAARSGAGRRLPHDCPQATRSAVGVRPPGTSRRPHALAYSGRTGRKTAVSTTATAIEGTYMPM